MSRRYPTAELYEERERDFYARPRQERNYDELDIDISRTRYPERAETVVSERQRPGRQPDFLRDDYGRTNAGPLVLARDRDDYSEVRSRRGPPPERMEKEELVIRERDRRGPPTEVRSVAPARSVRNMPGAFEETDVEIRREHRDGPPGRRGREVDETDVIIRRNEGPPPRPRSVVNEPPPRPRSVVEREDIVFRRGQGERERPPPQREVETQELVIRRREEERSPPPRSVAGGRDVEREQITIRERERSVPPPRRRSMGPIAREREEFVFRRREPSPPPREFEKEEIIIRRRERTPPREPSPEPIREPTPPPPPPEPIMRPPIVQEIITHHRHIDHGVERARSPTPPPAPSPSPPPPPPVRDESLEIEIRRRGTRNGQNFYEEDIIYERERDEFERRSRAAPSVAGDRETTSVELTRRRSASAPRRRPTYDDDVAAEAEYYNRKMQERAYVGEAYNGATKDWAIVDVPPGTKRVQMEGAGGGKQELTWQRYNGVRRSKFYADDEVYASDFGIGNRGVEKEERRAVSGAEREGPRDRELVVERERETLRIENGPTKSKVKNDMWTEVTKDLVIKEAIEEMGYEYEETEHFFYVIEYLQYEDVLQLVELSEDIRRERRERIREIQWEREELERMPPPPKSRYDERLYEREIVYDRRQGSGRYR